MLNETYLTVLEGIKTFKELDFVKRNNCPIFLSPLSIFPDSCPNFHVPSYVTLSANQTHLHVLTNEITAFLSQSSVSGDTYGSVQSSMFLPYTVFVYLDTILHVLQTLYTIYFDPTFPPVMKCKQSYGDGCNVLGGIGMGHQFLCYNPFCLQNYAGELI